MDRSIAFDLVSFERTQDSIGQWTETEMTRTVFGQVGSVSMDEFFSGGQNGFKPELRVTMFGPDYEGEKICMIGDYYYTIYRVYYTRTDTVELYLERRVGANNRPDPAEVTPIDPGGGGLTPIIPPGGWSDG